MKIAKKITTLKEAQKFDPCYLQSHTFYPHFPIFLASSSHFWYGVHLFTFRVQNYI